MGELLPKAHKDTLDTALYLVAGLPDSDNKSQCHKELSYYLTSSDAALCIAASNDDLASMAFLIDHGANPEAALATAAQDGHTLSLEYLLQQGAQNCSAALKIATERGQKRCQQILMKHSLQGQAGCTIL